MYFYTRKNTHLVVDPCNYKWNMSVNPMPLLIEYTRVSWDLFSTSRTSLISRTTKTIQVFKNMTRHGWPIIIPTKPVGKKCRGHRKDYLNKNGWKLFLRIGDFQEEILEGENVLETGEWSMLAGKLPRLCCGRKRCSHSKAPTRQE